MSYVIAMLLLVSCMNTRNHPLYYFYQVLCMVNPKKSEQKPITKNFPGLPNNFPMLSMVQTNVRIDQKGLNEG